MLHSVFLKTLRGYWIAILGWGLGLGLMVYGVLSVYSTQYATPQARQEFAAIAQTFRFFGEPVAMTTATGFVTWRSLGIIPVLLGIWGVLAGSRLVRGAEERGYLEVVLGSPLSRTRYLLEGVAAFTVAVGLIGLIIGLAAYAGAQAAHEAVDLTHALLTGFAVSLMVLFFGLLALLVSHLVPSAGAAAGIAGGLLALSYMIDGAGRTIKDGAWLSRLSPYHLYTINKPLIVNYDGTKPLALLGLLGLCLVALVLSVVLLQRRDLGGVVWGGQRREMPQGAAGPLLTAADRQAGLRGITALALLESVPSIVWWLLGLGGYTLFFLGITRSTKDQLLSILNESPLFAAIFASFSDGSDLAFIGSLMFFFLPLMVTLFALLIAGRWARSLEAGYFELVLAKPISRSRLFLQSLGATVLALPLVPLILWLLTLLGCRIWGLAADPGKLLIAFLGLLALELLVAAFVYCFSGWLRANTLVGLGGGLLVASFLLNMLGPIFKWPESVLGLSLFHQFGSPLVSDPRWLAWGVMVVVAVVLLVIGYLRFQQADLERGS